MQASYSELADIPPISLVDPAYASRHRSLDEKCGPGSAGYPSKRTYESLFLGLRRLRTDHQSGAKELATSALETLLSTAEAWAECIKIFANSEERPQDVDLLPIWWYAARKIGWVLGRYGRVSMGAAITSVIIRALEAVERELEASTNRDHLALIQRGVTTLQRQLEARKRATAHQMAAALAQLIRERAILHHKGDSNKFKILTLSYSSTIRNALDTMLRTALQKGENVPHIILRILESRPLYEGVRMARALVQSAHANGYHDKLQIEIATDASVAMLARDADLVLLGADRISSDGDVSNKIGSLPVALCARAASTPALVAVISEAEKIARPGSMDDHGAEENDPSEVSEAWDSQNTLDLPLELWNRSVEVRNVYFEWVPAQYIDVYICEDGLLRQDEIGARSTAVLEAERRMFACFE